jgi:hypothetical protein
VPRFKSSHPTKSGVDTSLRVEWTRQEWSARAKSGEAGNAKLMEEWNRERVSGLVIPTTLAAKKLIPGANKKKKNEVDKHRDAGGTYLNYRKAKKNVFFFYCCLFSYLSYEAHRHCLQAYLASMASTGSEEIRAPLP